MAKRAEKLTKDKVESIKVDQRDEAAINDAVVRWDWTSRADILRTAIRVGLKALREDPSPLGEPPLPAGYLREGLPPVADPMGDTTFQKSWEGEAKEAPPGALPTGAQARKIREEEAAKLAKDPPPPEKRKPPSGPHKKPRS